MDKNEITAKLNDFPYDRGDYWLAAGGAMVMHGIRPQTTDIDLGCTARMADRLESDGVPHKLTRRGGRWFDFGGEIEIFEDWLCDTTVTIDGFRVVSLRGLMEMKRELGREKDIKDIELIERFIENRRAFEPSCRQARVITTERLRLAPVSEADRAALISMLLAPEISKTYMVPELDTDEKRSAVFQRFYELSHDESRFVCGIFKGERLIGMMHEVARNENELELGWFISPSEQNKGYASEALTAAIKALFAMGISTVGAGAFFENAASIRVMQKCGMKLTPEAETISYRGQEHKCVYYSVSNTHTFFA